MNRRVITCVRFFSAAVLACVAVMGTPAAQAQSLPSGWSAGDVGSVGASGSASASGSAIVARGAGADIWGTADGFHFTYRTLSGDGEIVARVSGVDYLHAWSKAGVMMRESLSSGSRHAFMLISAGKGAAFQRRTSASGASVHTDGGSGYGGYYVKLARSGHTFDAYKSADGSNWTWVGSESISMASTIYVGVAVTSHYYGALATGNFASVAVNEGGTAAPASSASLPSGWSSRDVGGVAAGGWASGSGSSFTVSGSGADVWETADEFHFSYRTLSGDGSIVARVTNVDYLHAWTKAGVMMRESLSAGAGHAFMLVSAGKGLAFQRRPWSGASTSHTAGSGGGAPSYVKLSRVGSTFRAYQSSDGTNWTHVGSETISMGSTIYVGLATTSHADGAVASASFSNVSVSTGTEAAPVASVVESPSASSLRVLHWNVHHLIGTDGRFDPDRIAYHIARMTPDVISLNEVDDTWQAEVITNSIRSATGRSWYTSYSGRGNFILSRYPMIGSSVCTYNSSLGRKAAHMSISVGGRVVNLWSAHLGLEGTSTRLYEVYNLQSCASSWGEARIIAGDFNMQASSSEYYAAVSGYIDAWSAAKSLGTAINYYGNCDGCTRNSRIDYIFSSGGAWFLSVKSAQMYDTRDSYGYMPSDHKPLVVTYSIR